ncbi:MAG TPA: DUF5683 domain-containing protein [Candidatus Udaeobacter sp.]|nr:DUF5683 domain-containing protein [Candidatus Udaeobacter sp.]
MALVMGLARGATGAEGAATDSTRATAPRLATPDSSHVDIVSDSTAAAHARLRARGRREAALDSAAVARLNAPLRWSDQPRMVMLRSVVVPGWGQLHNHAYWKAGFVAAGEGFLISAIVNDRGELDRLHRAAIAAQADTDVVRANAAVNAYNDRLDRFIGRQWLLAGVVVYSMLDAYVDAHFKNFDIEFRHDPALPGSLSPATSRLDLRWTF